MFPHTAGMTDGTLPSGRIYSRRGLLPLAGIGKAKQRCSVCGASLTLCMCAEVPRLDLRTKIALVIHHRELSRSSNTGLLAHQSLVNSEVRIRGESREALDLSGLLSPELSVVIVLSERRCAGARPGTGLPGFAADPADRAGWHLAPGSKDSFPPPRAKKYSESEDQHAEPRNFSTARSKPAGKDGNLASHRVRAANHRRRSRGGSAHEALSRQGRSNPKSAWPSMDKRLAGRNRGFFDHQTNVNRVTQSDYNFRSS